MGVIERLAKHLTAGQILKRRGNAAAHVHRAGVDGFRCREPRQRGAESTQQKKRFDQIAPRLLDGQCRQVAIVERAFGHHAINRQGHLRFDLGDGEFRHTRVAATFFGEQRVGILDGFFAPFNGYVHRSALHFGGARQAHDLCARR